MSAFEWQRAGGVIDLVILALLVLAPRLRHDLAHSSRPYVENEMMWNLYQMSWFWPVCTVVALVLLSIGIVLFSRWFSNNADHDAAQGRRQAALDIARERFARGEITARELEVIKLGLKS